MTIFNVIYIILCFLHHLISSERLAELYTKKMFQLLQSAYSTISIQDTALFLGMNEDNATNCKSIFSFLHKFLNTNALS